MTTKGLRATDDVELAEGWQVRVMWLLAGCAVCVGVVVRFQVLGERQWTTDEYFFLKSVGFVLDRGVPAFETGGYYVRGLLLQYLIAGLWWVFGDSTALARAVSAAFSLGSIPLAYAYARHFVSRNGAVAVAIMLALSSWEIEFAGFARMYAAAQFMTLAFLLTTQRLGDRAGIARYAPHGILLLTALMSEQAVVLAPLLLLIPLRERCSHPLRETAIALAVCAIVAAFVGFDFRNLGVAEAIPADFDLGALSARDGPHDINGGLIWVPAFPFWSIAGNPFLSSLGVAALLGAIGLVYFALHLSGRAEIEGLWAGWLFGACLTHQFVIAGIAGAVLVFRYGWGRWSELSRGTYVLVGLGALAALAWIGWAALTLRAWTPDVFPGDVGRAIRFTFLGLPNLLDPLFFPWRAALPLLGAMIAVAVAVAAWFRRAAPIADLVQGPLAVAVVSLLILGVIATPQLTTRYTFYLYPVLLILVVLAVEDLVRASGKWVPALSVLPITLALFAIGGDFHPRHILDVNSTDAMFRTGPYARYEDLWYQRIDFQSAAEYLNRDAELGGSAPVIVVGQDPIDGFLERPFAVFMRPNSGAFMGLSRAGGTVHIWSAQPIVSTPEQLEDLGAGSDQVWIVRSTEQRRKGVDPGEVWADRFRGAAVEFVSRDGRLEVVRVSLAPTESAVQPAPNVR